MRIWVNGALRDEADARVSVFDHGLTVGDGVFETVKTAARPALRPHPAPRPADPLGPRSRPAGPRPRRGAPGLRRGHRRQPHGARPAAHHVHRRALPARLRPWRRRGRASSSPSARSTRRHDTTAVITVPWTRNERGALAGLKTTSYAENVVALARAHEQGASEALFANTVGQLCEGTGTNVFVVLDGRLHTPPLASGCLAGITRALVVEWAGAQETELPHGRAGARRRGVRDLEPAGRPGRPPDRRPGAARHARTRDGEGHASLRRACRERPRSVSPIRPAAGSAKSGDGPRLSG